jgi:hypothetical protein
MALGPGELTLGLPALYIAGVLTVNLVAMKGKADPKDAAIFNFLVGFLATMAGLYNWLILGSPLFCAQSLLFAFTYWWLGYNWLTGRQDSRALGWFCLFVAINVIPFAYYTFQAELWILGINWILWGLAWFSFFLVLGIQKAKAFNFMWYITLLATIVLWVSALGWLIGWMDFAKFYGF